jgi:hypothetical protein
VTATALEEWRPASDPLDPVVLIHRDAQDAIVYWCGYTNGRDGQGWTAERAEASEFTTFALANLERKVAKRWHPGMTIDAERMP